ncbi:MAG: UDP-N-acetylmuramate dehydrogenase [Planctomycetota bacterium]
MSLFDDLADICRPNAPLAPLSWFRLGGSAEFLLEPRTEEQLVTIVKRCRETDTQLRVLGRGANILVSDDGVPGAVVRLTADPFMTTVYDTNGVTIGAGADLPTLARNTVRRGLAGVENLAGIPGTIGGAIRMNCGGRYGEIGTVVGSIRLIGPDGNTYDRDHDDLQFAYRHCDLGEEIIVGAVVRLREDDPKALLRRFREIWMYKQNTQPPMGERSAGCIFKNPAGRSAGELIDRAGLKGLRVGSARVSERHANFILADSDGRARDVLELMRTIQDRVLEHSGIRLEPEIEIW